MKKRTRKRMWRAAFSAAFLLLLVYGCGAERLTMGDGFARTEGAYSDGAVPDKTLPCGPGAAAGASFALEREPPPEIDLVMVGDMLMHMRVTNSGRREDGTYNYDHLFTHTKERISRADIAIVNQEVILGGRELGLSGYPAFNAPYEVGDALAAAGFDAVLHATNHALDKGKQGVRNCLGFWKENYPDMAVLGVNGSAEDRERIYIYEQEGIRVAILNYTYGTNGIAVPKGMPYLVNLMDEAQIREDVERAGEEADFIVACPHWGTEYRHSPSAAQEKWAEVFLECGVDLVIGTHPHVIEPVEWLRDEEGHEMLVYYSLGNYVNSTASDGARVADRMLGAMATVTISKREDGEAYISRYGAEPLVTYVSADGRTVAVYPLEQFTDEMAENSLTYGKDSNFSVSHCKALWREVFGELGK